jgi:prolyl-tRNA editing enzyme YbaK/EbsC (Cys-tRNA(Pro) deacylase)
MTALHAAGLEARVRVLADTARTATDAANALGVHVGQIASSLVFRRPDGAAVLVVTSGRHRVDLARVAAALEIPNLLRADAEFVKTCSGYSVGGVAPVGWIQEPARIVLDVALADYAELWAAAGHPHAVFPVTFEELCQMTQGLRAEVGA